MNIYLLAGLGLDKRTFDRLQINASYSLHFLDWVEPHPRESIASYAQRMLNRQIAEEHRHQPIVFIGHSFGGVMVQEIARLLQQPTLILLLSSIKSHEEKPWWQRKLYRLPFYWLSIKFFIRLSFPFWARRYGYKNKTARKLFLKMISRFSNRYFIWATRTISYWQPKALPKHIQLHHIHGSIDAMFPASRILHPVQLVEGGNHFMPYHQAETISKLINSILKNSSFQF